MKKKITFVIIILAFLGFTSLLVVNFIPDFALMLLWKYESDVKDFEKLDDNWYNGYFTEIDKDE